MSALIRVAGILLAGLVFLLPASASAASLLWTVAAEDDAGEEVEIIDGGEYSVSLNEAGTAHVVFTEEERPSPCFLVVGSLYRLDPEDDTMRILVASSIPSSCGPSGATADITWTEPGSYELDIVSMSPPMQVNAGWGRLAYLLGSVAEAQAGPVIIDTLHFTIEELVEEPVCPDLEAEACYSNVLFLPGIEASRLYNESEKLWEPNGDGDIEALFLNTEGESIDPDIYTKEGDVLDELPFIGANIYKSFIADMDALVASGQIVDWQAVAYDWRLSLDDILEGGTQEGQNISFATATDTPYVIQELRRLAASSKSGKVTIIAHSNGGLLAKRLTQVLGDESSTLIDKMILVASPQAGTPDAVAIALHGENIGPFGVAGSAEAVRTFASTSPMVYHLLPSERYFTYVDDPIVSFNPELEEWIGRYGETIHSEESLHAFLVDSYGRVDAKTGDIEQPVQMHEALLDSAEALHDELDVWMPPSGVELIQIAGWGIPTLKSINYGKDGGGVRPFPSYTSADGDGKVLIPSALWTSASGAQNYWINIEQYNKAHWLTTLNGRFPFTHKDILEIGELRTFISDQIKDTNLPIVAYAYLSTQAPSSVGRRLQFELHSPLTLDLYDSSGNHTGVSTTTGEVVEGIPGTYYITFGEQQYIFADAGTSYTLSLDGYDSGTFTLAITETEGDSVISSITFADVPVTPNTVVALSVPSDMEEITELAVDEDGDGETDFTVSQDGTILAIAEPEETETDPVIVAANGPPVETPQSIPTPIAPSGPDSEIPAASAIASPVAPSAEVAMPTSTISQEKPEQVADVKILRTAQKPAPKEKPTTVPMLQLEDESSELIEQDVEKQVAAVAQVTESGLWSKAYHWIMSVWRRMQE